jgi:hypothetical protein
MVEAGHALLHVLKFVETSRNIVETFLFIYLFGKYWGLNSGPHGC